MIFKPGDVVMCEGSGPYTLQANSSSNYPLKIKNDSFTLDGRRTINGPVRLELYSTDSKVQIYSLGQVQTLDNGIQIYHPTNGQPFQLIPTTKALL